MLSDDTGQKGFMYEKFENYKLQSLQRINRKGHPCSADSEQDQITDNGTDFNGDARNKHAALREEIPCLFGRDRKAE